MVKFGDYIVYVDESGDHGLVTIDPQFPVFVLAFCVFEIASYVDLVVPSIERLKFEFFGHDTVILHENDIRKSKPPFDILRDATLRQSFMQRLTGIIAAAPFTIVASVIRKELFRGRAPQGSNPYHVAMQFGLERVFMELQAHGQRGKPTYVVFESRGAKEDLELELEFRRIMDRSGIQGMADTLRFTCVSKQVNSSGLQLADMIARPIGLHSIRPDQVNRAWDLIQGKIRRSGSGNIVGYGLKTYP